MINIASPKMGPEEKKAVMEVLDSGMLAQGPKVKEFEEAFAEFCGVKHAIATTSGTTALHTALLANKIGPGDEVITSPFTFIASANSILFVEAKPVFIDINPETFNLDVDLIEGSITSKTKAIMPIDLFGLCAEMDQIMVLAEKYNLAVIEDACQSHGASIQGKMAGAFGTGTFSLYPTKNMTSGEGGMITTDDQDIADDARVIRQHGMRRRYYHDELGYNFRMTDVLAAIGNEQLKKLPGFNKKRQENAAYLSERLSEKVVIPFVPEGYEHVFHQYTIRVSGGKRDALIKYLRDNEIGSGVYYPVPIHKQTYYVNDLGYDQTLPESELAAEEVVSLPIHPGLTQVDLDFIVSAVNDFFAENI